MFTRLTAFALIALGCATGCSSSDSKSNDDVEEGALGASSAIKGAFTVTLDSHRVEFDYAITEIDMEAKTVLWNAKLTEKDGHPTATSDVNVEGKIVRVARCAGCFSIEVPGRSHPLAEISVDSWKVTNLKYENVQARLKEASATGGGGEAEGSPNDVGACTQICSGGGSCKDGIARRDCNGQSGLFPTMRCPTTFKFEKGARCD